jgi:predicted ATP-binding protein involved in virulence
VIIQKLELKNFRRFENLKIDFHPELTVIVARNGQGKTSVLDGITVTLGTFVGAFEMGKAKHIEKNDVRLARFHDQPESAAQYPAYVEAVLSQPEVLVQRELTGPKNKTTIRDARAITEYGEQLQQMVRSGGQEPLPLVSYYGAGRLWRAHKNVERKQVLSASRTMGYEDCLSPASNFVQCQQWMTKATFADWQEQSKPDGVRDRGIGDRLTAIQDAVNFVLAEEGWSDFRYSPAHEELTMFSTESGYMPVSMLSDGVRAMVAMVADIAFRCVRLNGYLGREAVRQTQGIVLIDEVDIHLHPAWQQRVIGALRKAFPRIQFVVTTHSPQVLSTIRRENIRILPATRDEHEAVTPSFSPLAHEAGDALARVMETHKEPPMALQETIRAFEHLVRTGREHSADAQARKSELDEAGYQIHDSDLLTWRFLASRHSGHRG